MWNVTEESKGSEAVWVHLHPRSEGTSVNSPVLMSLSVMSHVQIIKNCASLKPVRLSWCCVSLHIQRWKQLSRLQRSLILFMLLLLFICGVAFYPTVTKHLRGNVMSRDFELLKLLYMMGWSWWLNDEFDVLNQWSHLNSDKQPSHM